MFLLFMLFLLEPPTKVSRFSAVTAFVQRESGKWWVGCPEGGFFFGMWGFSAGEVGSVCRESAWGCRVLSTRQVGRAAAREEVLGLGATIRYGCEL